MGIFSEKSIPEINQMVLAKTLDFAELLEETENKIQKFESLFHVWTHYDVKRLKATAKERSDPLREIAHKSPLAGLPCGIKDIFNTKDFPTEMGSPTWKDFTPGNNARVVDAIINSGALVVGKTVTAEFAVHELNATLNPHDITRTPGTSSSGSAVAVSTGMVPFALATQTAGSIVRPASFCGIWGMKPSFGLIPRTGVLKTTDSLDTIGFVAAHGKSLRPILDSIRVRGPDYPLVFRNIDNKHSVKMRDKKPIRIGFVKTHVWNGAEKYVRDNFVEFLSRIEGLPNISLEEIAWPSVMESAHEIHKTIYDKSLSYYFQNESKAGEKISSIMTQMIQRGLSVASDDFRKALSDQEILSKTINQAFLDYDCVLSIGTSSDAPPRSQAELPDPSLIWTLCHLPVVAVPTFRSPADLPFGIQIVSRRWNDYQLLEILEILIDSNLLPAGSQPIKTLN